MSDIKSYWSDLSDGIKKDLLHYDNIFFESIAATMINQINMITQGFKDVKDKEDYVNIKDFLTPLNKMLEIATIICIKLYLLRFINFYLLIQADSIVLSYQKLLLEEYQIPIVLL